MGEVFANDIHATIYDDFEVEFLESIKHVFVNDSQQNTYSIANAAFILKVGAEIESIAKTICEKNGSHNDEHVFDHDCMRINKPKIETIAVFNSVFHFSEVENTILFPFEKDTEKPNNKMTYGWNYAYQNIKHGTLEDIKQYGTIKYMLRSLAALYLLNYTLIEKFLKSQVFCYVFNGEKIVKEACLAFDNLIEISDEQKQYLKSKSNR